MAASSSLTSTDEQVSNQNPVSSLAKFAHLQIPLANIVKATNNFHPDNFISHGDFGPAYKGKLLHSRKLIMITARRLEPKHGIGDLEFWTEIKALSDLKHPNIVSLIGYCDEKDMKIIITTYESNGSLNAYLNSTNLTWTQRLRITVGVARALSYLHHEKGRDYGFIHRNVNRYTILLDDNWEAKLSCFEISIRQSVNQTDQIFLSNPIGLIGYMDPTFEMTGCVTYKSDVYSFGVVLFEILCGREAFIQNEVNRFLAPLAKYHYENGTLQEIIHPELRNQISRYQISLGSLRICSKTAYSCLQEEPAHRPYMHNVVDELEKALEKGLMFQPRPENLHGKNLEHLKIRLDDIKLATHNFSEAFAYDTSDHYIWYKTSELNHFDKENRSAKPPKKHKTVSIKRFLPRDDEHEEELFFTELEVLTSVKHPNIVTLIGFCVEGLEMILVFEEPSNGCLRNYLGNVKMRILTWEKRLKICIDAAHALNYLHSEMEGQKMIIHSNIHPGKFQLDENWEVKIDDFEWAVFQLPNQKDEALCKRKDFGTNCHVDPEYVNTGKLKRESDVYSFGVVLFEILCGTHALDQFDFLDREKGVVPVARKNFYTGTLEEIIDPTLKGENSKMSSSPNRGANKESLSIYFEVANQCVAETQDQRPTMKVVLSELKKALHFQVNQEDRAQELGTDQVTSELEKATHEILVKNFEDLKIPLAQIQSATNDFSDTYRIAYFNSILFYRAELELFDKDNPSSKTVLIKRYPYGQEKQFLTEIEILSSIKHPNIATLLGFCVEAYEMILVVDNFSNGFLAECLKNIDIKRILTWEKRLKICIDVAHALRCIHYEMEDKKMRINRDIHSYNIGLDKNWGAKIVSFWWTECFPPDKENEVEQMGRPFYTDPEYVKTRKFKTESDVYSFGVVLFETLCGRVAFDSIYLKESDEGLAFVARRSFNMKTIEEMIDPLIKEETCKNNFVLNIGPTKESLHAFIEIAHQCIAETQDQRPTMKVVVKELEKALFFQKNNKDNPIISLEDVNHATKNFHNDNCIGGGGFGKVYKGYLQDGDEYKTIAAKRLDTSSGQGHQQFLSELQILLEYKHENVIGLVGYCDEKNEKVIVYEYALKGSLDRYLSDVSLTWEERLNICIDVASALYFFHGGVGKQAKVIHRDIKTANILLNHDWKAKLADFGLSLISPINMETDFTIDHVCGTDGYWDPLYKKTGFLTIESDIYSFGVVLFEILCGRSTFIIKKHDGFYLPDFIKNKFEEGKHDEVVFKPIREQIKPKSLTTFQKIAYKCLHHEREERPTTKEVLMQLKKALMFQNMASTMTKFAPLQIPLEDVVNAIDNFHDDNIIQHSGFKFVTTYKGQFLWSGKEMKIVARRFDCKHDEGELMFLMEISALYDLKHTNLVSIIGFCDEKEEKIIVTTYASKGSLKEHLNSPDLTWAQRLRICVGAARALSYLHYDKGRDYSILHCNINSDTILLDDSWEAKLSSFEISIKQSISDKDQVCLCEHTGTMECMDPAIEKTGGVTHKSDIYSFGVVLFEILCGRKAFIHNKVDDSHRSLAQLVEYNYKNRIMHPHLLNQTLSPQSLFIYSEMTYICLNENRAHRPYMYYVVANLEKALELQLRREDVEKKLPHLKIHLSDIKLATDDFSETYKIATLDAVTLYKVEMDHFDKEKGKNKGEHPKGNNTVFIKRYASRHKWYGEEAFFTDIEMLTSVKHRNIVTLLGFCVEESEMILVIDSFINGFLGLYLENKMDRRVLTWEKRLKICIDVAHVLKYIHYEMEDQKIIINRDINSYNIGLDENREVKIVNFCFSVSLPPNQEALTLNWNARPSYIDPEYKKTSRLKRESDVYSFGVVLFEILCGRIAFDPIYKKENDKGLGYVARQRFNTGTLEDMVDHILKEETGENNRGPNKDSLNTFMKIAYQCVAETQDERPTMKDVVKELEKALFLQVNVLKH